MKVGERIKYFRKLKGLTQKELGLLMGFEEKNASMRILQYEKGIRTPSKKTLLKLTEILGVSQYVFEVQDLESELVLIHVLFELENIWDIDIEQVGAYFILHFADDEPVNPLLYDHLSAWRDMKEKYKNKEISQTEYNEWKNTYSGF